MPTHGGQVITIPVMCIGIVRIQLNSLPKLTTDSKAAGGKTGKGGQPGNMAIRPVCAGVHDTFLGQRNRATNSGVLSPAMANRRVQTRAHQPVGESPTEARRLKPRS